MGQESKGLRMRGLNYLFLLVCVLGCLPKKDEVKEDETSAAAVVFASLDYFQVFELSPTNISGTMSHTLHQVGQNNHSTPCRILKSSLSAAAPQLIVCYLDVEELDLYFNGAEFNLKVPSNVCEYISYRPFWFYDFPPGNTTNQQIKYSIPSSCLGDTSVVPAVAPKQCPHNNPISGAAVAPIPNCDGLIDQPAPPQSGLFDHSDLVSVPNAPNCDEGEAQVYTVNFSDQGANCQVDSIQIDRSSYGGKHSSCARGPGVDFAETESGKDAMDYPLSLLVRSDQGIDRSFQIEAPISKGYVTNKFLANYTYRAGNLSNGGSGSNFTYEDTQIVNHQTNVANIGAATALNSVITRITDPLWQTNSSNSNSRPEPFYTFTCLDHAFEVKGRIRILIREWDREFNPSTDHLDFTQILVPGFGNDLMDTKFAPFVEPVTNRSYNNISDWDNDPATGVGTQDGYLTGGALSTSPIFNFPARNIGAASATSHGTAKSL